MSKVFFKIVKISNRDVKIVVRDCQMYCPLRLVILSLRIVKTANRFLRFLKVSFFNILVVLTAERVFSLVIHKIHTLRPILPIIGALW